VLDPCCGRLGIWQGRLHIYFSESSVRFDLIKEDVIRLRVTDGMWR
jgi:hypothetical protein